MKKVATYLKLSRIHLFKKKKISYVSKNLNIVYKKFMSKFFFLEKSCQCIKIYAIKLLTFPQNIDHSELNKHIDTRLIIANTTNSWQLSTIFTLYSITKIYLVSFSAFHFTTCAQAEVSKPHKSHFIQFCLQRRVATVGYRTKSTQTQKQEKMLGVNYNNNRHSPLHNCQQ